MTRHVDDADNERELFSHLNFFFQFGSIGVFMTGLGYKCRRRSSVIIFVYFCVFGLCCLKYVH